MKNFKKIKVLVGLFLVFSLFPLANVSAMETKNISSEKEVSLEKKNYKTMYTLNLNITDYATYGYSKEIVDQLKDIDVRMVNFVKTSFEEVNFKKKGIHFNGKRKDILKYYNEMYECFACSFEQLKEYSVFTPKNIEYIDVSEDCSKANFKLNCCEFKEEQNVENSGDTPFLKKYVCEALIREVILYYIENTKNKLKQKKEYLTCFNSYKKDEKNTKYEVKQNKEHLIFLNPDKYKDREHEAKLRNVLYEVSELMEQSFGCESEYVKQQGIKFNSTKEDILKFYKAAYTEALKIIAKFFVVGDYTIYSPENIEDIVISKDGSKASFKFKNCDVLNKNLTEKDTLPINYPVKKDVYMAVVEKLLLKYIEGEKQNKKYLINLNSSEESYNETDEKKRENMKIFEENLKEYINELIDKDGFRKMSRIRYDSTKTDILNFYEKLYPYIRSFCKKNQADVYKNIDIHLYDPNSIECIVISDDRSNAIFKLKYNDYVKNDIEKYLPSFGDNVLKRNFNEVLIKQVILAYIRGLEQNKQYLFFVKPSEKSPKQNVEDLDGIEKEISNFVKGKNIVKDKEIEYNGKNHDILKYYKEAYDAITKAFKGELFKDDGSLIYNPINIKNIEILDDESKVVFKFKYNSYIKNTGAKYLSFSNDNVLKEDVNQFAVKQIILPYIELFKKYKQKQHVEQSEYLIDLNPSKNLIIEYGNKPEEVKKIEYEVSNLLKEKSFKYIIKCEAINFDFKNDDILKYYKKAYEIVSEFFRRKFEYTSNVDEEWLIYNPENIKNIKISDDGSTAMFKFKYNKYVEDKGIKSLSKCYGNVFRKSIYEAAIRQIILSFIRAKQDLEQIPKLGYVIDLKKTKKEVGQNEKKQLEKEKFDKNILTIIEKAIQPYVITQQCLKTAPKLGWEISFNFEEDDILKYYKIVYESICDYFKGELTQHEGSSIYSPENIKYIEISDDFSKVKFNFKNNEYVKDKGARYIYFSNDEDINFAVAKQIFLYYIKQNYTARNNYLSKTKDAFVDFLKIFPKLSSDVFDLSYNVDKETWANKYWQGDVIKDYFRRILYFVWDLDTFDREGKDGYFQDFIRYAGFLMHEHFSVTDINRFKLYFAKTYDDKDLYNRIFGYNLLNILKKLDIEHADEYDETGYEKLLKFSQLKEKIYCKKFNELSQKEKNFYYMYMFLQPFLEYFKSGSDHKNITINEKFEEQEDKFFRYYKKSKEDYYKFLSIYYSLKKCFDVYDKKHYYYYTIKDNLFEDCIKSFTLDRNISPDFKTILDKNLLKPFYGKIFNVLDNDLKINRDYDEMKIIVEMFRAKMKNIFIKDGRLCCKTIDGSTHNFLKYFYKVFENYRERSLDDYSNSHKQKFTALSYFKYLVESLDKAVNEITKNEKLKKEEETKEEERKGEEKKEEERKGEEKKEEERKGEEKKEEETKEEEKK